MEATLSALQDILAKLLLAALVFGALSFAIKRGAALVGGLAARREIGTNLGLLLFNGLVLLPLVAVPVAAIRHLVPRDARLLEFWDSVPFVLALTVAVLVIDLAAYWRHRWEHSRVLWRIHATHHADEAMNWLTLHRKHPLGELLSLGIDLILPLVIGLPMEAILAALLVRGWWGYFIHADVPWTLGPLGKVLISPAAHRLHHIRDEALMGANYGNTVTLWDRVFGTYVDPLPHLNCETGIAEGTRDVAGELLRPFEARYRQGMRQAAAETAPI